MSTLYQISKTTTFYLLLAILLGCKDKDNSTTTKKDKLISSDVAKTYEKQNNALSFWNTQRKGVNYFNEVPTREWFEKAAEQNIKLVRFTWDKWKSEEKDFLMGNADDYQGLVKKDLKKLTYYLNLADSLGIKVVLTPIGLPGARFIQNNKGKRDGRLWKQAEFQQQAIKYWQDLAGHLKNYSAIVGYNLKNEPVPEFFYGKESFWDSDFSQWKDELKGTLGDLNLFNKRLVRALREVDQDMPIIIESGFYATPWTFEHLDKLDDSKVIYSFHMYEPYEYTTKKINQGKFGYPGKIMIPYTQKEFDMNRGSLRSFLKPVIDWAEENNIPNNRIFVGEFGCDRTMPGATEYLRDLISIFNQQKWHWALYAYREDEWSSMDYELGTKKIFWKYWDYQEAGTLHQHYDEIYGPIEENALWKMFDKEFE